MSVADFERMAGRVDSRIARRTEDTPPDEADRMIAELERLNMEDE